MIPLKRAQLICFSIIALLFPAGSDSSSQKRINYSYFRNIFEVTDLKYKRTRKPYFIL